RDDVAEHIVGYDHVEAARVAHHLHAQGIDVHVGGFDLGKLAGHFCEGALPESAGVGHSIGFVAHQDTIPRTAISLFVFLRIFKGKADHPLHSLARVHILLDGDFVGSSLLEDAPQIAIDTLRVFSDDDEINVHWLHALERTQRCIQQEHGADVGIEVHVEADGKENLFCTDIGCNAGIAERTDQYGVKVPLEVGKSVWWNGGGIAKIALGAPVKIRQLYGRTRSLDHLDGLRNNFLSDPIPWDYGNPFFRSHGKAR